MRAHRGRIDGARSDLDAAAALRDALTDFPPWYDADVSMLLFRAALRLSDSAAAREHLERSARLLRRVPDAVVLQRRPGRGVGPARAPSGRAPARRRAP